MVAELPADIGYATERARWNLELGLRSAIAENRQFAAMPEQCLESGKEALRRRQALEDGRRTRKNN